MICLLLSAELRGAKLANSLLKFQHKDMTGEQLVMCVFSASCELIFVNCTLITDFIPHLKFQSHLP